MPKVTIKTATPQLLNSPAVKPLLLSAPAQSFEKNLQAGGLAFFIFEHDQPRGFAMVTADGELLAFVLDRHHQRGFGTQVAMHAVEAARQAGRTTLRGTVLDGHPGHKLAQRVGFSIISSHQLANGKIEHIIQLAL